MASDDIPSTPTGDKKTRSLTTNDVDELKMYFSTITPKKARSGRHAIIVLHPDIERLKQIGYTDSDICQMFEKRGFHMPLSTFRSYLRQAKKAHEHDTRARKTESRTRRPHRHKSSEESKDAPRKSTTGRFEVRPDGKV